MSRTRLSNSNTPKTPLRTHGLARRPIYVSGLKFTLRHLFAIITIASFAIAYACWLQRLAHAHYIATEGLRSGDVSSVEIHLFDLHVDPIGPNGLWTSEVGNFPTDRPRSWFFAWIQEYLSVRGNRQLMITKNLDAIDVVTLDPKLVEYLSDLQCLEVVSFQGVTMRDDQWRRLPKTIRTLVIGDADVTPATLHGIAIAMPWLESLAIIGETHEQIFSAAHTQELRALSKLRKLDLSGCKTDDQALAAILAAPNNLSVVWDRPTIQNESPEATGDDE